jgi:hypothetical protein
MSTIRDELMFATIEKAYALIDYNAYDDSDEAIEFVEQFILADKSLTKNEKSEAIERLYTSYDYAKVFNNEGKRRVCENCEKECLAISYCEYCIRNYLKTKFLNWTSGNNDIDNLIQKCQMESLAPDLIIEWISYNNLQNIEYLTKGGCSEIYTADWIDGNYNKWDITGKELKRFGTMKVILKKLMNVGSANRNWFDEVCIQREYF